MLNHLNGVKTKPSRVVILGANGFVGSYVKKQLQQEGVELLCIGKQDINLLDVKACDQLCAKMKQDDVLVIVSALAPCKNNEMLIDNLRMMQAVCKMLEKVALSQIVYISSDAVYADEIALADETSYAAPASFHGMMHSARELMLKQAAKKTPLAILRPSILYGAEDPHNGYGPNRFRRLAEKNEKIVLFGNGEEKRDNVFVEDVAKIVTLVVLHRSTGVLNIVTGESPSFREIAETVVAAMQSSSVIEATPRQNPITHRHYNIAACQKAFPTFQYTPFKEGFAQVLKKLKKVPEVA